MRVCPKKTIKNETGQLMWTCVMYIGNHLFMVIIVNTCRRPLIYNIWKLVKSFLFQLTHHNNEFLISWCLFISELTLKIVFWENLLFI